MAEKKTYGSIFFGVFFSLLFLFPFFSSASAAVEVTDLRYSSYPDYTRVVIALSEKTEYAKNRLSNPDRLYFDIKNSRMKKEVKTTLPVGNGMLGSVRAGQFNDSTVRVVLDLEKVKDYKVMDMADPARIMIDIYGDGSGTPVIPPPSAAPGKRIVSSIQARETMMQAEVTKGLMKKDVVREERPVIADSRQGDAAPASQTVTGQGAGKEGGTSEVRISSFATREEAEKFVKEIRASGYETEIRSERTPDNRTIYGVFVLFHGEQPKESLQLPITGESGKGMPEEMPAGTKKSFGDVLGGRSFFHASLALTELYTDNAFINNQNRKSGSSTILSPEVWLLLPSTEQRLPQLEEISATAPGGLILSRTKPEVSRRYEAFLLYHADIPLYSNLPAEKTVSHRAAGGLIFNGNRVFASITDQFERSYDVLGTGIPSDPVRVDKYKGNVLDVSASYDTRNRIRLMIDYSNFLLRYSDPANDFQDRMDNSVAGYVFYQIQPKTALFVEYDFINISHDNDRLLDSNEHLFFGGAQWDITAKSRGIVKAGYGIKDFVHTDTNAKNYIFEVQVLHHFSSRDTLTLDAYRQTDETDFLQTTFILRDAVKAQFAHRLTERFTAYAGLGYARETYEGGDFTLDGVTQQRKDNVYDGTLSLGYLFNRWLQSDIGYEYTRRDSNFSNFSYTSNTIFFRVKGMI